MELLDQMVAVGLGGVIADVQLVGYLLRGVTLGEVVHNLLLTVCEEGTSVGRTLLHLFPLR